MADTRAVLEAIKRHGGLHNLPPAPDGPIVPEFDARKLAEAIEHEIARAHAVGWTRISLHMDLMNAIRLAQALRRHDASR